MDIATLACVSKATVSYYLNGKFDKMSIATKNRIEHAIQQTGYKPSPHARQLNAKKTRLIGVIVGDITNSYSNQVLRGIKHVANEKNYHIVATDSEYKVEDELSYVSEFISMGVDGFIVQPSKEFKTVYPLIKKSGKPLVCFDRKLYDFSSNWIKTDNYNATYDAIKEAMKRGYKNFVMIGADEECLSTRQERSSGFTDALLTQNIPYTHLHIDSDQPAVSEIQEHLDAYFTQNPPSPSSPTLIFAPNCWNLPAIYEALTPYLSFMPTIGLLGFDNPDWVALTHPSISTINQPAFLQGEQAALTLISQIKYPSSDIHKKLPCTTIWRDSTLKA